MRWDKENEKKRQQEELSQRMEIKRREKEDNGGEGDLMSSFLVSAFLTSTREFSYVIESFLLLSGDNILCCSRLVAKEALKRAHICNMK